MEKKKEKEKEKSKNNDHRIESTSSAQERDDNAASIMSEQNITRELQQLQKTINNQSFEHGTCGVS